MSAEATFWAWRQQGISASAKLVLLCLADCHNADTGRCDPSAKYIAEKSELNIKTIPAALHRLEEFGLISIQQRPGNSPNYTLNITQNWDTPKTGVPKNGIPQKRTEGTPKTGEGGTPKTGDKPITKPKKNLKDIYEPKIHGYPQGVNAESWIEWVSARKARGKPITSTAARKQLKFLLGYDQKQQEHIIDQSIANDYQGLFPPKGASHAANQQPGQPSSAADRVRAGNAARAAERESALPHQGKTFDSNGNLVGEVH